MSRDASLRHYFYIIFNVNHRMSTLLSLCLYFIYFFSLFCLIAHIWACLIVCAVIKALCKSIKFRNFQSVCIGSSVSHQVSCYLNFSCIIDCWWSVKKFSEIIGQIWNLPSPFMWSLESCPRTSYLQIHYCQTSELFIALSWLIDLIRVFALSAIFQPYGRHWVEIRST